MSHLRSWAGFGALIAAGFLAWPQHYGGDTGYTIVSGHSMNPRYHTGDLLITRGHSSYHVGQIVVYQVPKEQPGAGFFVVHRLIGGDNAHGWTTKGDNNPSEDIWHPHDLDIQGAVMTMIPKGGYLLRQLRNPLLYALLGGCYAGYLMWPRARAEDGPDPQPQRLPM
jgi:signal peptidase